MERFWKKLRIAFLFLPRLLFAYFTWILPYSRHPERYPIEARYARARKLLIVLMKRLRFNLILEGKELLENDGPVLYMANHVSALDPLALILASEKPVSFIAKIESKKYPFAGRLIKAIDGVFLDREDPFQAVKAFRTAAKNMEEHGLSYCIFPEGTREKHPYEGRIGEFHPGSFRLAYMAKCPIIEYAQFGSFHAFDERKGRSQPLQLRFLHRLDFVTFKDIKSVELSDARQLVMGEALPKLIAYDQDYYRVGENKAKPAPWWKGI